MKMISCSSFPMIGMKTCQCYQTYTVQRYSRIETLNVCAEEKNQLHDILNIMTRSMAKTKQADVPSIYPLKGEHKKPEHTKQVNIDREVHDPNRNVPEEIPEN